MDSLFDQIATPLKGLVDQVIEEYESSYQASYEAALVDTPFPFPAQEKGLRAGRNNPPIARELAPDWIPQASSPALRRRLTSRQNVSHRAFMSSPLGVKFHVVPPLA
jgi:hypothetical protein